MKSYFLRFGLLVALVLSRSFASAAENQNNVLASHSRDLMVLEGDKLISFEASGFLQAPYTVLYFGAGWCPDCRHFSPSLVAAYNQQTKAGRRFEVLLFSMDKTADGLLKFMKTEKMTWPALAFDKTAAAEDLKKYYSGHGIPCLSVIDPKGKLLLQSKSDQDGQEVLQALQDLVRGPHAEKR